MKTDEMTVYAEFARRHYAAKDAAHDFRHIRRIIARLPSLSRGMAPAPHKLHFLAAFHGLGNRIRDDGALRTEVAAFLRSLQWSETDIEQMFASLLTHLSDPRTPEEMIVHDANYVEVVGAFGIAKAFTTGGARGQTYEATADIFEHNLSRVVFRTPEGKRLAEERRSYSQDFLERLRRELEPDGANQGPEAVGGPGSPRPQG